MRVLVFAPHNDDEVLGAGGTILKYSKNNHEVFVCEVTSTDDIDLCTKIKREAKCAHEILGIKESFFLDLPVVGLKEIPTKILNQKILEIVEYIKPNIAFIPHRGDIHIDHRETANSVIVALRPFTNIQLNAIYAYETLSETEWNAPYIDNAFIPNVYSDISNEINEKINAMKCYKTQIMNFPHPRSLDAISSLARYRGATIGVCYAESFMLMREKI